MRMFETEVKIDSSHLAGYHIYTHTHTHEIYKTEMVVKKNLERKMMITNVNN